LWFKALEETSIVVRGGVMILRFLWAGLFSLCFVFSLAAAEAPPPNFIVIFIDDLGHTDLGCQGSTFYQTPEIDRLAREGVRCTTAYSACTVCSPSRAALMTGKYPARLHITDWIAGHNRPLAKLRIPDWQKSLPLAEQTIAEVLAERGYVSASFGKWHLGGEGLLPTDQGFASHRGGMMHGQPPSYFDPYKLPLLSDRKAGEYLTDRLTDEVTDFLTERAQEPSKPFFVYLPHFTVHTPLQAKTEKIEQAKQRVDENYAQKNPTYAAMIASLDESVGKIRAKLDELKLTKNTIIIFTSDNGGLVLNNITANPPFRAGKGSAYEGGCACRFLFGARATSQRVLLKQRR
jgi:arylsulfatase A